MKITATVARILLGFIFFAAGLSGFLLISHPPAQPPGLAGQFQDVFFRSYWVLFVDGVELIAGVLLLSNRYVPLALTVLAGVIANIIVFHVTMAPMGLPIAAIVAALWAILATRASLNLRSVVRSKNHRGVRSGRPFRPRHPDPDLRSHVIRRNDHGDRTDTLHLLLRAL